MRFYDVDCRRLTDRETAHAYLKEVLDLPDYYGGNLDALYDCLTDPREFTILCLTDPETLERAMGDYGRRLVEAIQRAGAHNPDLYLTYWHSAKEN